LLLVALAATDKLIASYIEIAPDRKPLFYTNHPGEWAPLIEFWAFILVTGAGAFSAVLLSFVGAIRIAADCLRVARGARNQSEGQVHL
jgi:hypothetical protein